MARIDTHRANYNRPNVKIGGTVKSPPSFVKIKPVNGKYVVYEHKPNSEPYVWLTTASLTKANLLAARLRKSEY